MTEEDKNLLLKDLCARLQYGFKYQVQYGDTSVRDVKKFILDGEYSLFDTWMVHEIKPYLRPMSDMTEEEFYELKELGVSLPFTFEEYYGQMQYYSSGGEWGVIDVTIEDITKYMNYLNAHHFDYCGLIENGLALEAPDGMYIN